MMWKSSVSRAIRSLLPHIRTAYTFHHFVTIQVCLCPTGVSLRMWFSGELQRSEGIRRSILPGVSSALCRSVGPRIWSRPVTPRPKRVWRSSPGAKASRRRERIASSPSLPNVPRSSATMNYRRCRNSSVSEMNYLNIFFGIFPNLRTILFSNATITFVSDVCVASGPAMTCAKSALSVLWERTLKSLSAQGHRPSMIQAVVSAQPVLKSVLRGLFLTKTSNPWTRRRRLCPANMPVRRE